MEIIKHYKITKWCQYEEVALIGDVSCLTKQPNFGTITTKEGHACNYDTWLNEETGEGWEIRTYTVKG